MRQTYTKMIKGLTAERLARFMHKEYEKIAEKNGWKTQEITQKEFDDLPEENKKTMLEVADSVINFMEGFK